MMMEKRKRIRRDEDTAALEVAMKASNPHLRWWQRYVRRIETFPTYLILAAALALGVGATDATNKERDRATQADLDSIKDRRRIEEANVRQNTAAIARLCAELDENELALRDLMSRLAVRFGDGDQSVVDGVLADLDATFPLDIPSCEPEDAAPPPPEVP